MRREGYVLPLVVVFLAAVATSVTVLLGLTAASGRLAVLDNEARERLLLDISVVEYTLWWLTAEPGVSFLLSSQGERVLAVPLPGERGEATVVLRQGVPDAGSTYVVITIGERSVARATLDLKGELPAVTAWWIPETEGR